MKLNQTKIVLTLWVLSFVSAWWTLATHNTSYATWGIDEFISNASAASIPFVAALACLWSAHLHTAIRFMIRAAAAIAGSLIFVLFYGWVLMMSADGLTPLQVVIPIDVLAAIFILSWTPNRKPNR